jgi:hypothetical protein
VLEDVPKNGIRAFVVWQPMLPTDWVAPTTGALHRIPDPRVQQYWDPTHLVADRLKADARPPQPEQECCVRAGILWDLAAVYPPGVAWEARLPPAVYFNGPVVDVSDAIKTAIAGAAPQGNAPK